MSLPNPFVGFWVDPVGFLAALAYALFLTGTSVALAGLMWSTALHLQNVWEFRTVKGKYGPEWTYVPPLAVIGRVAALLFAAGIEALLLGGLFYLLGASA